MHEFNFFIWLSKKVSWLSWVAPSTVHMITAAFVAAILLIIGAVAYRKLRKTSACVVPPKGLAGLFDAASEGILKLMEGVMGDRAINYLPLIGTIFIYIFCCNIVSFIPGFIPPTDNINTNIPMALTVFAYYNYRGIREHGFMGYLKHFAGPVVLLAPLMFTIELVSHCVRPVSLSVRLFGNITGDHLVLGMFSEMTPFLIPVIFMFLGLFVAFIQAFVFSLLSTVYIALAVGHEE